MKLNELKERMEKNELFLSICAHYLNNYERLVTPEMIDEITNNDRSYDQRAFVSFISAAFIDDEILEKEMEREYFSHSIKKLSPEKYKNDPYFKNIKITDKKIGSWTLSHQKYAPYEAFVRDDYTLFDDFREVCNIGFFDEEFSYPTVFENGVEWMAIKPNEIETMKEPIEKAHGDIVVFGLGLGYYAYMTSLKENVRSITVIERDENVIKLFSENILPHFGNGEKITIIKSDAFSYAEGEMKNKSFDFAFVDLWRDISDGTELYIKMKKLEQYHKNTEFAYWIERSILISIRKNIFYAILKSIDQKKNTLTEKEIFERLELNYIKEFVKYL
ncbi:MAG: hypothetical protein IJZ93_05290 [Clostridia bacterium]|nr:hypothetical protein [Clostridia bacterium]